jgi:hypothetical protein
MPLQRSAPHLTENPTDLGNRAASPLHNLQLTFHVRSAFSDRCRGASPQDQELLRAGSRRILALPLCTGATLS